jgi:predicted  nucleic acid-binding Zn-ribbon protein
MEESGRLAALQLELDTKAAAVRQLRDELASKDEELEFLREELHTKTEELEEVRICFFCLFGQYSTSYMSSLRIRQKWS